MRQNETEDDKKSRLNRCMNVLRQAGSDAITLPKQSAFQPLKGIDNDPRAINFNNDEGSDDDNDVTIADLVVLNKGKKNRMNTSLYSNF